MVASSSSSVARQEAAVDVGRRVLWDDVVLVAGVEHRHVAGVLQGSSHEPLGATEVVEQLVEVLVGPAGAGDLGQPVEQRAHRGDELARPLVGGDPRDGLGQPHDRVLVVGYRAVPGTTVGGEPEPGDALLGGLQQVGAPLTPVAVGDGDAVAADLADRLGDALEDLGVLGDHEVRALGAAGLLVREEHDDQVAGRSGTCAGQVAHRREHHRVHVLHVDRAAAPHAAVTLLPRERVDRPVGGVGRHHVEVPVHAERTALAVGTRDAHGDADPPRVALEGLRLQADLAQQVDDVLGRLRLAGAAAVPVVAGVDPDELLADPDDLVLRAADGVGHGQPL